MSFLATTVYAREWDQEEAKKKKKRGHLSLGTEGCLSPLASEELSDATVTYNNFIAWTDISPPIQSNQGLNFRNSFKALNSSLAQMVKDMKHTLKKERAA